MHVVVPSKGGSSWNARAPERFGGANPTVPFTFSAAHQSWPHCSETNLSPRVPVPSTTTS
jgi:hypothetical protein